MYNDVCNDEALCHLFLGLPTELNGPRALRRRTDCCVLAWVHAGSRSLECLNNRRLGGKGTEAS